MVQYIFSFSHTHTRYAGQKPSLGTLLKAALFLEEELPIRLARRVVELENLPHGLSGMPSVIKVKNWYAESFQELIEFPKIELPASLKHKLRGNAVKRLIICKSNKLCLIIY